MDAAYAFAVSGVDEVEKEEHTVNRKDERTKGNEGKK